MQDVQKCSVQIISSWPSTAIVLTTGGGISCGPQVVGEYNIKYQNETSILQYEEPKDPIMQASFTFYIQREMGPIMNGVIVPCMMLFVVGYSSMFLTAQPARAAFAIITLLSNLNVMKTGQGMMPEHTGNIWLDDWLMFHLFIAFIIVIANVLSFHHYLQIPKLTPEDGATGEITCLLRLQKMAKGVLPSTNWVDFSMQRVLQIVYVLAVISMFIKLGGVRLLACACCLLTFCCWKGLLKVIRLQHTAHRSCVYQLLTLRQQGQLKLPVMQQRLCILLIEMSSTELTVRTIVTSLPE